MVFPIDLTRAETAPFTPEPPHRAFAPLAGSFRGKTKLWLDPSKPPEESPIDLSAEVILGGRWLRLSYRSFAFGGPHAGQMLLGFHKDAGDHELAWVDSSHTGSSIMWCTGKRREDGVIDVLGSYTGDGERWGWRTLIRSTGKNALLIEALNVTPQGEEQRAISFPRHALCLHRRN